MPLTRIQSLGITDGTIVNADINASAAIAGTKLTGVGKVLQVVQNTFSTATNTTSDTFVTTGLSASITPSSASNKVLIICTTHGVSANASSSNIFTLFKGTVAGTNLGDASEGFGSVYSAGGSTRGIISIKYLDSPSTTSSQTYTLGFRAGASGNSQGAQFGDAKGVMILMEIAG